MTQLSHAALQSTRRTLNGIRMARALLLAACAGFAIAVVALLFARLISGGIPSATLVIAASIAGAVAMFAIARWRTGRVGDLRAALWMEERAPVGYALVALAEDAERGGALLSDGMRAQLRSATSAIGADARLVHGLRTSAKRQLLGPSLFAVASLALLLLSTRRDSSSAIDGVSESTVTPAGTTKRAAEPIGAWNVLVTPPGYSGLPVQRLRDAGTLRALAGSRVEVQGGGAGTPEFVMRVVSDSAGAPRALTVAQNGGDAWGTAFVVPPAPVEVRGTRGGASRLLLVEGYADSIPHVSLTLPKRDSVLRQATGKLPLDATMHDDLGLASGSFELIVSSGEGERFTARTVLIGAQQFAHSRDARLRASLDLDALKLGPGDVIHLRAVARDAYPLAGRESGSSETRSFRIARQSEYDSVAVEPAPPPAVDSSLLSQRMLLMLTERLEKRRPSIGRPVLVSESQRIARDQAKLRLAVGSVVFQRLSGEQGAEHAHFAGDGHEHAVDQVGGKLALPGGKDATGALDEGEDSPIIAINKPLLEAYNAMWDAGRALEQAEPREAIPHMKIALAAIERARAASRLYLRGKPPVVIVDIAKVRLAGKDTGRTNVRSERAALPPRDAARERRLLAAAALLPVDASAGRDSLAVLRLESLGEAPLFATALKSALDALAGSRDVTFELVRARRALGGTARVGPSAWSRPGIE